VSGANRIWTMTDAMTDASTPTAPDLSSGTALPTPRRSPIARRRRIFMLIVLALLVIAAVLANYGPVQSYVDAHTRADSARAKVAALEAQKADLQSELGKLAEADYLESLARKDLTYARPGEDVYIVTGLGEETVLGAASATDLDPAAAASDAGVAATGTTVAVADAGDAEGAGSVEGAGFAEGAGSAEGAGASPAAAEGPGFLERLLSGFLSLF
jgi:cell division protein FtsB